MSPAELDSVTAFDIIESLRDGIPPQRFVSSYASGNEEFLASVRKRHLETVSTRGRIRFISGSWGAGKTHFLRLLREEAFSAGYLVSTVELSADATPFNKFEQVFFEIVRRITSPEMHREGDLTRAAPFGEVLRRHLFGATNGAGDVVSHDRFQEMREQLMRAGDIDVDFRRMIVHYWETFLPEGADPAALEERRGQIMQWFAGEGTISLYRREYGVQKLVSRANARLMLQSLSRFAIDAGHRGLLILLDEAEMTHSILRKASLKQAHNNLLHLINSIEESEGLFLVYAATPDFFVDDRYGVIIYGALSQRIGRPEDRAPRALDRVWNLDALETSPDDFLSAASKIRDIYLTALPDVADDLISGEALRDQVSKLVAHHPEFSHVSTWRVVVTGTVEALDTSAEGEPLKPPDQTYEDIMLRLRDLP
jgi:hypothetical protein